MSTTLMAENRKSLIAVLTCVVAVVVLRNAWICDDAYITVRTIDNFVHGYGLVWNVSERVQAFTHPLWLFVLTPLYALTGEPYFTILIPSIVLATVAFRGIIRLTTTIGAACLSAGIVVLSKSLMDFATSGLETPLIAFLLVYFFRLLWTASQRGTRSIFVPTLVFSLLLLTRMDLACMILPPYLHHAFLARRSGAGPRRIVIHCCAGLTPIVGWLMFSTLYYGFPFPNTAYAKLATGIGLSESIRQGAAFYIDGFDTDPITVLGILFGAAAAWKMRGLSRWFACGVLIYTVYVLRIGGDFMGTRFLFPPLVICVLLVSVAPLRLPVVIPTLASLLLLGLTNQYNPVASNSNYQGYGIKSNGIADERGYYYRHLGLLRFSRKDNMPFSCPLFKKGAAIRKDSCATGRTIVVGKSAGLYGYAAGPNVHIVDPFALCDPLLARLPARADYRIGHFLRNLPLGYVKALESDTNRLASASLNEFRRRLTLVTSGPIFRVERFREICRFNLRLNDDLAKASLFTADAFAAQTGTNVPSEGAFSDATLSAGPGDEEGFLAFGNYFNLRPGRYAASFRVRGAGSQTDDVCRLEVAADKGQAVLTARHLSGSDFGISNDWFYVDVPFASTAEHNRNIETRVYYTGNGAINLDTVEVTIQRTAALR